MDPGHGRASQKSKTSPAMTAPLEQALMSRETPTAPDLCHFFTLPAELRHIVYKIILVDEDIERTELAAHDPFGLWPSPSDETQQAHIQAFRSLRLDANLRGLRYVHGSAMPGILLACKQIYAEALDLWYAERTVLAGSMRSLFMCLCRLEIAKKAQIQRVRIMRDYQCSPRSRQCIEGFEVGAQSALVQLRTCTNLRYLTLELGFYWPELRHYPCLDTLRR